MVCCLALLRQAGNYRGILIMTDIISDSLTRIRNAQMRKHKYTLLKCSKHVKGVLDVLVREGYIEGYQEVEQSSVVHLLKVDLKYYQGQPVIHNIERVSKPGRRVHMSIESLPKSEGGLGIYVVSTSKGVLSDYEARVQNVGGEIVCKVF
jgi:small subunit ribosomal protein S8